MIVGTPAASNSDPASPPALLIATSAAASQSGMLLTKPRTIHVFDMAFRSAAQRVIAAGDKDKLRVERARQQRSSDSLHRAHAQAAAHDQHHGSIGIEVHTSGRG